MNKRWSLQAQLTGSFLLMGLIVASVGGISWWGTRQLSSEIYTLSDTALPSIMGLWEVNEGQTQIQSAERGLLNFNQSDANQQIELDRIDKAWQQIDQGFARYEVTVRTPDEEKQYQALMKSWPAWETDHKQFMQLYRELRSLQQQSPTSDRIIELQQALQTQISQSKASFDQATADLLVLIETNTATGDNATTAANYTATQTTLRTVSGATIGFVTAVGLGTFLSTAIAKPLGKKVGGIVQNVVTSSSEIAATIEQQERALAQQASSVSETTTTMDELGVSSRQSAEQAEASAIGAMHVLDLAENGSRTVNRTLEGMTLLQDKVGAIAEQILRLSEQTSQIGSISELVSDLANQTNMLALNAAVEAVRAGEHGRGFAVVSSEIRKLADQSKQSAERINNLVNDIQTAINSTVMVTDEGTKVVQEGATVAQETAQTFAGVTDAVNSVVLNSQQISLNIKQQAAAVQQVLSAMNSLNTTAQETVRGIGQAKVSTQQLNQAALDLKTVV